METTLGRKAIELRCLRCQSRFPVGTYFGGCPRCRDSGEFANLTVEYRQLPSREQWPSPARGAGLARFEAFLPVDGATLRKVSLGEGDTPLLPLGPHWGTPALYAKDESRNPTWSHKDRYCAAAVARALELGYGAVGVASTGNHGVAAAAYAARAGLKSVVFTSETIPLAMRTLIEGYGGLVIAVEPVERRRQLLAEAVEQFGIYPVGTVVSPPVGDPFGVEGYKTIAYEICEDMNWEPPSHVVVPVSHGDCLWGVWKGFRELKALGLISRLPRMVGAEVVGPLAYAWENKLPAPVAVKRRPTIAFSIGSNQVSYQALAALRESDGLAVVVDDDELLEAQRLLAAGDGLQVEYASAAALAAVRKLVRTTDHLDGSGVIVALLTSSALKNPPEEKPPLTRFDEASMTLGGVLSPLMSQVSGKDPRHCSSEAINEGSCDG